MAVTVNKSRKVQGVGDRNFYEIEIAAGWADADTIQVPLNTITGVLHSSIDATIAAADAWSISYSGNTLTLHLIGTARALSIQVRGY